MRSSHLVAALLSTAVALSGCKNDPKPEPQPEAPTISSTSPLPGAYAGQPYSTTLEATGGTAPLTFSVSGGTLPTGLSLSSDGILGPAVAEGLAQGSKSTFTVTVTDANGMTGSKEFELTTYQLPQLSAPTALTTATEGVEYRRSEETLESFQAQFGQGALAFSATGLPAGLTLDAGTGALTGIPAQGSAGSYSVTFSVKDAGNKSASKSLSLQVVKPQPINYGGVMGLAPSGSRLTDTLTVFAVTGRLPVANVGVRVRKNGQEYNPPKEALTDASGKAVFTGLGLNGTTDSVDVTANGKDLTNTTYAGINAALVTVQLNRNTPAGPRVLGSSAYDPTSKRFLLFGGFTSGAAYSLFYTQCLNDTVELMDVAQKSYTTRVVPGLTTSPSPRYDAGMAVAGGTAVLFGGRKCIDAGDALGDTWEYDLTTNTWASISPAGAQPGPRRAPAMARDAAGKFIYMVGGYRVPTYSNEVWRYDPANNTWTAAATAPFTRAYMGVTTQTVTGEIWFCGGRNTSLTAECQAFDPSTGTWSVKPSLPSARIDFPMAFDPFTETLYAFGGRTAESRPFGDLLKLRKGATAWESVIPPGATPPARYGNTLYFDVTRRELVLALGSATDPVTLRTTRFEDMWTFDGQAWTERGAAPTAPSYSVSGQISGGPANGQARLFLNTPSGYSNFTTVPLDDQGRGTYTFSSLPPGDPFFMSVTGQDTTLEFPRSFWTYAELQHAGLAANATVDVALPPGPAVLLQATGAFQLPASWRNQSEPGSVDSSRDRPEFPFLTGGVSNLDDATRQFTLAFAAPTASEQVRFSGYISSQIPCEDHGLYTVIGAGNVNIPMNPPATEVSPGLPECVFQGPRGVGTARQRVSATGAQRFSVADVDGDTLPELLIPYRFGLSVLWGSANVTTNFPDSGCCVFAPPSSVIASDFNKDGRVDLAATDPATNTVNVMLAKSSPARSFDDAIPYPVGANPTGLAAADVNLDGFQDLLVASQGTNTVKILYGNDNGTFSDSESSQVALAGTAPTQILVTNLDGDNRPDLVVLVAEGLSIALDGITQDPFGDSKLVTAGTQPTAVVVGRLNGDTLPDLAVANAGSNNVSLLLGAGSGTFASPVNIDLGKAPGGIALGELTGDGNLDLAVSSPTDGTVIILQGASNGTFTEHSRVPVQGDPRGLAVADLNADGLNDVAVASPTANSVYLLMGQRPAPVDSGNTFSFTAPADSAFMWSMHGIEGHRRYWDYYAPIQPGPVSYSLPLPSTLAPSSAPVAPASGKVELAWTPWVRQWQPSSPRKFNPRQFSLNNLGQDAETQPGASHYFWP